MLGEALGKMDARRFKKASDTLQAICKLFPEIKKIIITKEKVEVVLNEKRAD